MEENMKKKILSMILSACTVFMLLPVITFADTTALERDFGFKPSTTLRDGLRAFAEWYKKFYKV